MFSFLSTAEILQANDSLTHVINLYKQQVKGEIVNGNNTLNAQKQAGGCEALSTGKLTEHNGSMQKYL